MPGLFTALKATVDRRREPGRFLLTGSANVLLVPTLADSLAGRMEILRLFPLAQSELAGRRSSFLEHLLTAAFKSRRTERLAHELADRIVAGGYPAALARSTGRRRAIWYRDYLDAIVQRDVRGLGAAQCARDASAATHARGGTDGTPTERQRIAPRRQTSRKTTQGKLL